MKVLVAEDDAVACNIYRLALEARGHHVTITHDGRKCLEVYRQELENVESQQDEPFGAVVLDYKMPEVNGLEVAKEILTLNKKQRIIFASSYVKEVLVDSVKHLQQIVELVQKPFEPKVLVDLVEDISTTKELEEINKMVMVMDRNSPDSSQMDSLLEVLKRIQKVGLC